MIPFAPSELDLVIEAIRGGETVGSGGPGYSTDYAYRREPAGEGRWVRTDTDCGDSSETVASEAEVRAFIAAYGCGREFVLAPHWAAHRAAVLAGDTAAALAALARVPAHDALRISAQVAAIHRWPAPAEAEALRLLRANAFCAILMMILRESLGKPDLPGADAIMEGWIGTVEAMLGEPLPKARESLQWYR